MRPRESTREKNSYERTRRSREKRESVFGRGASGVRDGAREVQSERGVVHGEEEGGVGRAQRARRAPFFSGHSRKEEKKEARGKRKQAPVRAAPADAYPPSERTVYVSCKEGGGSEGSRGASRNV